MFDIISVLTISSTNQETIWNFINNETKEHILNLEIVESKNHVEKLNEIIRIKPDILVFGEKEVIKSIDKIKQIYYSKNLEIPLIVIGLNKLGQTNKFKLIGVDINQMEMIGINCIGVKFWNSEDESN